MTDTRVKIQLTRILRDIDKRMSTYHSLVEPTSDEITITWLLAVIADLKKENQRNTDKVNDPATKRTQKERTSYYKGLMAGRQLGYLEASLEID